jgi:Zn-dependent peptidase ImmA (M78 family)/DNA-binding XRE family transcriptional regulator
MRELFLRPSFQSVQGVAVSTSISTLAERIKSRRKALGLNQKSLAELAGFSALQTISQIEKGQRDVRAWELVRLAKALRTSFADLLTEEGPKSVPTVLWRNPPSEVRAERESAFLESCRRYAHVSRAMGAETRQTLPSISVNLDTFDWGDAQRTAHELWKQLGLGARPAASLAAILEERYGVQVWHMDLQREGSAACIIGESGPAILMNRSEAPWRRNFNFGHELFHLLTWHSLPAEKLQDGSGLEDRVEKLANAFSSSLLLPAEVVIPEFDRRAANNRISYGDLIGLAREFEVSTEALLWRLVTLRRVTKETVEALLQDEAFQELDRASMRGKWWDPPPLPERFVRLAFLACMKGKLSRMRLAQYLNTSLPGLTTRLAEYGLDEAADYSAALHTA